MFVTGQQFSLADGRLNIDLSVDFEGLRMPSDESLTVTPVLISGETNRPCPQYSSTAQRNRKCTSGNRNLPETAAPPPYPQ